jgi:hypothetical protein
LDSELRQRAPLLDPYLSYFETLRTTATYRVIK